MEGISMTDLPPLPEPFDNDRYFSGSEERRFDLFTADQMRDYARAALAAHAAPGVALSPSEAVYGFAGWLTSRDLAVTFGATHEASTAAELVQAFCESQGLEPPRDRYADNLKPYPAAPTAAQPVAPNVRGAAYGDALRWTIQACGAQRRDDGVWFGESAAAKLARVLSEGAQPVAPLSDEQVDALIAAKHFSPNYTLKDSDQTCLRWYRLGLRDGERAHGIGAAQADTQGAPDGNS